MSTRQAVTRVGAGLLAAVLLFAAVYWGANAYLFTYGTNSNAVAVAASAACPFSASYSTNSSLSSAVCKNFRLKHSTL